MSSPREPDHRRRRIAAFLRSPLALAIVAAHVAAVLVVGSIGLARADRAEDPCPRGTRTLTVAASPDVAPVVAAVGRALESRGGARNGYCLHVGVTARPAAEVAATLATRGGGRPDVWIPDSQQWVRQAAAAGAAVPGRTVSIARSPVVLAVSRPVADRLGWPGRRPDVAGLFGPYTGVRLGLPDPQRWAPTVGGILGVEAALAGRPDGRTVLASVLRGAVPALPPDARTLLGGVVSGAPTAVPVSEQAIWADKSASAPVAVFPPGPGVALDYPYVVLGTATGTTTAALDLLGSLQGRAGRDRLRDQGFRDADGGHAPDLGESGGRDPHRATAGAPSAEAVDRALRMVRVFGLPSRMLAVIDVSGSMGEKVAAAGGRTRMDLTTDAAARGLGMFPDAADIGLWTFSTHLTGRVDHRELVSIGPLGMRADGVSGRERLAGSLGLVRAIPGGGTGLYDTVLAATRRVRAGWDPTRVNTVVVMTDGRNEDDRGVSLDGLLATLRHEQDPRRPVPVIVIALGPDIDAAALRVITRATGGALYPIRDPRLIERVFRDALGRRR